MSLSFYKVFSILILLLLCAESRSAVKAPDSTVLRLRELYLQGQTNATKNSVRQILLTDPDNPTANLINGLLILEDGNVAERVHAFDLMEKYSHKAENDPFTYFALGILYNSRRNFATARKNFLKSLELNTRFVPALVKAGESYSRDVFNYYYRITDTSVPLSLRDYALEDYDKAIYYLKEALKYDPENNDARYLMGSLYYELQEYDKMSQLFEDALKLDPDDKNYYLFAGLAYLARRQYPEASERFNSALKKMGEEEAEVFKNPDYLLPKGQQGEKTRSEVQKFWEGKDPMFLTPENERLLEHYGRVAYANLRFSVPRLNIEGWKTDRGKIYIRYGRPRYIAEYGKSMEFNAIYSPQQIWGYDGFQISFTDEFWNGNFRFSLPSLDPKSIFKERSPVDNVILSENIFQEISEEFDFQMEGGTIDVPYQLAFFRGQDGDDDGVLSYGLPVGNDGADSVKYKVGMFLLNDDRIPFESWEQTVASDSATRRRGAFKDYFTHNLTFTTRGGLYPFSVEVIDKTFQKSFVDRQSVDIPAFNHTDLMISDIVLADIIDTDQHANALRRHGLNILPNITHVFDQRQQLYIYFEVYNLKPGNNERTYFTVENTLVSQKSRGILASLFGRDRKKISIVNEYSSEKSWDIVVQSLRLSNVEAGDYTLVIKVADNTGAEQFLRSTSVKVVNSP